MKSNLHKLDRVLRIIVAVVVGLLYFNGTLEGTLGTIFIVVATIFALTSVINFCPLYAAMGISTKEK
jgi:hypothetical protein